MKARYVQLGVFIVLIYLISMTVSGEQNAVSYYVKLGNDYLEQNNTEMAIKYYDKAISLGNETDSPIFSKPSIHCDLNEYGIFSADQIVRAPIGRNITINLDISNPNNMQMRMGDVYINVIEFNKSTQQRNITWITEGEGEIRDYYSEIEPINRQYMCKKLFEGDFIKLAPNELEQYSIVISSNVPSIYQLGIDFEYTIGCETKKAHLDIPEKIEFFEYSTSENDRNIQITI